MKRIKISRFLVFMGCGLLMALTGCTLISKSTNNTSIRMSSSELDGITTKDISLDPGEDYLNLSGTITMSDGKVRLCITVKATGEELYAQEFTADNSGMVTVDIKNLGENKDLLLGLEATHAKDFRLDLTSKQNLILEPEKPSQPDKL